MFLVVDGSESIRLRLNLIEPHASLKARAKISDCAADDTGSGRDPRNGDRAPIRH